MTDPTPDFNARGAGALPGHLGLFFSHVSPAEVRGELVVAPHTMAPNGFLQAGSVRIHSVNVRGFAALPDTFCGYGCEANLPKGASGITTIELKSNHLGTAREGTIECVAKPVHLGPNTQVWDAVVTHRETGKTIALFRCTQMVLYPKD